MIHMDESDTASSTSEELSNDCYSEIWPKEAFSKKTGKPISVAFQPFADLVPEYHGKVPYDIDSKRVIVVPKVSNGPKISSAQDGPLWGHSACTKWAGFPKGSVKYSYCGGSLKCVNLHCLFWVEFGHPNRTQFDKNGKDSKNSRCRKGWTVSKTSSCKIKSIERETLKTGWL